MGNAFFKIIIQYFVHLYFIVNMILPIHFKLFIISTQVISFWLTFKTCFSLLTQKRLC